MTNPITIGGEDTVKVLSLERDRDLGGEESISHNHARIPGAEEINSNMLVHNLEGPNNQGQDLGREGEGESNMSDQDQYRGTEVSGLGLDLIRVGQQRVGPDQNLEPGRVQGDPG